MSGTYPGIIRQYWGEMKSAMDEKFQIILSSLPKKPPRSRLEPYREFIDELRQLGRTYQEIAQILTEKCQVAQ
jgi:hypothetical protein